jgi:hypothetical protein
VGLGDLVLMLTPVASPMRATGLCPQTSALWLNTGGALSIHSLASNRRTCTAVSCRDAAPLERVGDAAQRRYAVRADIGDGERDVERSRLGARCTCDALASRRAGVRQLHAGSVTAETVLGLRQLAYEL